jgi:hypothetical protein
MLEVIMADKFAEPRGSLFMTRLKSIITTVDPSKLASNADQADEESGFGSLVRLGARGPHNCYVRTS